jgi:protein arginine kinase activator
MKCQFCANPATVHLTDIINKQRNELHLCEACARRHHLLPEGAQGLNLPAILKLLLGQAAHAVSEESAQRACPSCGQRYVEFRHSGRLGCPHEYDEFRAELLPLLERIHRATRHAGKAPRRLLTPERQAALADLYRQLHAAVEAERYEDAARFRDLIRQKEAPDEPG